jgi:hypothetical protein
MNGKLTQKVAEGGQAIQSQGDVTVHHHHGITPSEMTEIFTEVQKQVAIATGEARKIYDHRINELEEAVMNRFLEKIGVNPEAFKDPGFQFSLLEAQKSYGASGDEGLRGTLVDIIARRSMENGRTRISIALDDAIKKSSLLSVNEYAELALAYILKHTRSNRVLDFKSFTLYLKSQIVPFIPEISFEQSSYQHIEAQGCASVSQFTKVDLLQIWAREYGGVLGKGLSRDQVKSILKVKDDTIIDDLNFFIPAFHDNTKLQPRSLNRTDWLEFTKQIDIPEDLRGMVWDQFANTALSVTELSDKLRTEIPEIDKLFEVWDKTPLQRLRLTTTGFAIAHAYAVAKVKLDASLSLWIK